MHHSPGEGTGRLLLPLRLTHKPHCLVLLHHAQFVPVQDLQLLQLAQHAHLVVGLMGGRVIEEVQMAHGGEDPQVVDDAVEVAQLVIVEDEGLDVPERGEDALDSAQLVVLQEEVLDAEVLLQAGEGSQLVVVQPHYLQVGEGREAYQDGRLTTPQVRFRRLLRLLRVFYRDDVPGIGSDLLLQRLVLRHQ
jgi:hypothetical protein